MRSFRLAVRRSKIRPAQAHVWAKKGNGLELGKSLGRGQNPIQQNFKRQQKDGGKHPLTKEPLPGGLFVMLPLTDKEREKANFISRMNGIGHHPSRL